MNLFQRLLFRRLCNEVSVDGGEGGGGAPEQEPAPAKQDAPANGDNSAPAGTEPSNTDNKANPEPKGDDKKFVSAAPEKYEFTAGEGQELDKEAVAAFEPIARELGLSNEQAQKIVDVYGSTIMPQIAKQQEAAWQKQVTEWAETVKADKELGSVESIGNAQKAMDQFGTPELKQYLNDSGLGNHPELFRIFSRIGKAMSEDGFVSGSSENARSAADVLFGDSK
ncbi:peptidase [Providencia rettgeri]|uniref:peptidase n=1 Tax=Providencia rettgeri TaxID=587 RepID=UPI001B36F2A8|nr:peptidase [Providencia rettgeri]ELR5089767.1 peptidase [Providencia rettgeri]MBQ0605454.1 peptidase [Providencia rettgeri]MCJ2222036.1 peptidase [Providencia rettgeri]MDI7242402.1 peptidase [Providencia rettgeri]MDY0819497.1 peptidase [Providencia rettgeri]